MYVDKVDIENSEMFCYIFNMHQISFFFWQVCLAPSSPPTFHFVLVNSLHRIITNVRAPGVLSSPQRDRMSDSLPGCPNVLCVSSVMIQSPLDWWPKIDTVYGYSGELRLMFAETLGRVVQGCSSHAPLRMTPVRRPQNLSEMREPPLVSCQLSQADVWNRILAYCTVYFMQPTIFRQYVKQHTVCYKKSMT